MAKELISFLNLLAILGAETPIGEESVAGYLAMSEELYCTVRSSIEEDAKRKTMVQDTTEDVCAKDDKSRDATNSARMVISLTFIISVEKVDRPSHLFGSCVDSAELISTVTASDGVPGAGDLKSQDTGMRTLCYYGIPEHLPCGDTARTRALRVRHYSG